VKKLFVLLVSVIMAFLFISASSAEGIPGIVAKVTTKKGPLKLRESADGKSHVLDEIPNGTCILVLQEDETWCRVSYRDRPGYCKTEFLTLLRGADPSMLEYRVLQKGVKGDDVLALKQRLQDLGYIRSGSDLTNVYNDVTAERVTLFQRQVGITEDGIASQELQAYLFSEKAPVCGQKLPKVRSRVVSQDGSKRIFCGCCMGEGCECCHFTGWIDY
jgi:murein L,D-transpeptidase YcbB/YkuD